MDENMIMQATCPFCGGKVKITERSITTYAIDTEAECVCCGMEFAYSQDFTGTKTSRVALKPSFEELWNGRTEEAET